MNKVALSATVLTLFPEMFPGPLGYSLAGKALEKGLWSLDILQIRDFAQDKHQAVDDTPYGGGAGMVMRADVLDAAIREAKSRKPEARLIYFTPRGIPLTQRLAHELVTPSPAGSGLAERPVSSDTKRAAPHHSLPEGEEVPGTGNVGKREPASLILLCGRYEGVDERVLQAHRPLEISLGDYVLSGGEIAAITLLDACVRLIPGVMSKEASHSEESFALATDFSGLLEYPHYTKPPNWNGRGVPDVLLSGNHAEVKKWRLREAEEMTKARRPDIWTRLKKE